MRGPIMWCPDHEAPVSNVTGCWQCRLEWEATDQAAGAAAARAALPSAARARRRRLEQIVPARDPARLEQTRAALDPPQDLP